MYYTKVAVNEAAQRRRNLIARVRAAYPDVERGVIVMFGATEQSRHVFRQESSLYYLSGVTEPGVVMTITLDGATSIYIPCYATVRERWVTVAIRPGGPGSAETRLYGVDHIKYLGQPCKGYTLPPLFSKALYEHFITDIQALFEEKYTVFTCFDEVGVLYAAQQIYVRELISCFPSHKAQIVNIAPFIHEMRRSKSIDEVRLLHHAASITCAAHESIAPFVRPGVMEYELQALIESVFIQAGAQACAFPSIVATGKNATILHYTQRRSRLEEGDLVIVDIGAEYEYYSADITRTYPVSGMFSDRQKEIYELVLAAQSFVASQARPGMYLNNPEKPDMSLNHLAIDFFARHHVSRYFPHSIGHYLGLDVHDVGDYREPLREGDVFTIEPGLYVEEEGVGVRIEDDYVLLSDGVVCLSEELPKSTREIEELLGENPSGLEAS